MGIFSKLGPWIKSLRQQGKYLVIGGIVFVMGLFVHFPLERFGNIITSTIQKNTGYIVQMEKLSLTLPIGVHGENVTIQPPMNAGQPFLLTIDELTIRPSILALITYPFRKNIGFSYKAKRGKEIWSGSADMGSTTSSLAVNVKNFEWTGSFPLDANPMFQGQSVNIQTTVNLDLELEGKTISLQQGNLSEANGFLEITSKKLDIEAPMVKMLNINQFNLDTKLDKGTLNIKKLDFSAPNVSGKSKGNIKLSPSFIDSQLDLEAVLKADPSDANISSLLSLFGSFYNIVPGADGSISLKINGPLNSPEGLTIRSFTN
ncbi:MAG: type II secretion system protein GspN [Bdellovibrionota bacterium]